MTTSTTVTISSLSPFPFCIPSNIPYQFGIEMKRKEQCIGDGTFGKVYPGYFFEIEGEEEVQAAVKIFRKFDRGISPFCLMELVSYKKLRSICSSGKDNVEHILHPHGVQFILITEDHQRSDKDHQRSDKDNNKKEEEDVEDEKIQIEEEKKERPHFYLSTRLIMPISEMTLDIWIKSTPREIRIELFPRVYSSLINGLKTLYRAGIIHRDIKSTNILVDRNGDHLKIIDFGLSRIVREDLKNRIVDEDVPYDVYTLGFRPFEVSLLDQCGFISDLWASGIILYKYLTGINPFQVNKEREANMILWNLCLEKDLLVLESYPSSSSSSSSLSTICYGDDAKERILTRMIGEGRIGKVIELPSMIDVPPQYKDLVEEMLDLNLETRRETMNRLYEIDSIGKEEEDQKKEIIITETREEVGGEVGVINLEIKTREILEKSLETGIDFSELELDLQEYYCIVHWIFCVSQRIEQPTQIFAGFLFIFDSYLDKCSRERKMKKMIATTTTTEEHEDIHKWICSAFVCLHLAGKIYDHCYIDQYHDVKDDEDLFSLKNLLKEEVNVLRILDCDLCSDKVFDIADIIDREERRYGREFIHIVVCETLSRLREISSHKMFDGFKDVMIQVSDDFRLSGRPENLPQQLTNIRRDFIEGCPERHRPLFDILPFGSRVGLSKYYETKNLF